MLESEKRETAESHWFASSCYHWEVGYDLGDVLAKLRERNARTIKSYNPKARGAELRADVAIYRVPLPLDAAYKIRNFAPDVDGVESLGHEDILREDGTGVDTSK